MIKKFLKLLIIFVVFFSFKTNLYAADWELSWATYDNVSKTFPIDVRDFFFSSDGTRLYITRYTTRKYTQNFLQYSLSTPWDITTATEVGAGVGGNYTGHMVEFNTDGSKMYGNYDNTNLNEYNLSTPWDITTISSVNLKFMGIGMFPGGTFKPDGTKYYSVKSYPEGAIIEYDLSTPWDTTTATANGNTLPDDTGFEYSFAYDIAFSSNGETLLVVHTDEYTHTVEKILQYNCTVPWDISTASYIAELDVKDTIGASSSVFISPDD